MLLLSISSQWLYLSEYYFKHRSHSYLPLLWLQQSDALCISFRVPFLDLFLTNTLLKSDVRHTPWSRVRCHGSHSRWRSLRITLKYTTLVHMRSGYAWTMKSWQRSEWRLGFNSVYYTLRTVCTVETHCLGNIYSNKRTWSVYNMYNFISVCYISDPVAKSDNTDEDVPKSPEDVSNSPEAEPNVADEVKPNGTDCRECGKPAKFYSIYGYDREKVLFCSAECHHSRNERVSNKLWSVWLLRDLRGCYVVFVAIKGPTCMSPLFLGKKKSSSCYFPA